MMVMMMMMKMMMKEWGWDREPMGPMKERGPMSSENIVKKVVQSKYRPHWTAIWLLPVPRPFFTLIAVILVPWAMGR